MIALTHPSPLLLCLAALLSASCASTIPTPPPLPADEIAYKQLLHADARELSQIAHDLFGITAAYETKNNVIILKGPPDAIKSSLDMMTRLDTIDICLDEFPDLFFIYHLRHARASEVETIVQSMAKENFFKHSLGHKTPRFAAVADTRTNALLVYLSDPSEEQKFRDILAELDRP